MPSEPLPKEKKVTTFPACMNRYHIWVSDGIRLRCRHCKKHPPQPKVQS